MENTLTLDKRATTKAPQTSGWFETLSRKLTPSYYGLIAFTITVGSCMGGIAAMFVQENHAPIWQLALVMSAAMANNVASIGQAPTKWVLGTFLFCFVVSTGLTILNLIPISA